MEYEYCDSRYAEWKQKIDTELELAKKAAEKSGLPDLIGSEKQINWAMPLRQKWYDAMLERKPHEEGMKILRQIIDRNTEAKKWIDNRDKHPMIFLNEELEALKANK